MPSQRASDRAVYELLARSPELQGRLEAFLRDHPDQMPARQRQVLMRSVEKAARDPRVGLALRDVEGDCEWWSEPMEIAPRGPFAVPVARGKFDVEADCLRAKPQAAPVPEPTGWRRVLVVLWSQWVLLATALRADGRQFWQTHVIGARISRRAGRNDQFALSIDMARLRRCVSKLACHITLQPHTASRGPPAATLLRTLTRWPAMRTVRIARARRQPVVVRG